MRIEINGIEREVLIAQAPKGSFFISEGCAFPLYPMFVAFCKPVNEECEFGNILVCPIIDLNDGYASCSISELSNEFNRSNLKSCISEWMEIYEGGLCDAVGDIMEDLSFHEIAITPKCIDTIKKISKGEITSIDEL